jgi:hypothetical protein
MKALKESAPIWPLVDAMRFAVCAKTLVLLSACFSFSKFNNLIVRKAVHFTRRSMRSLTDIYIRLTD